MAGEFVRDSWSDCAALLIVRFDRQTIHEPPLCPGLLALLDRTMEWTGDRVYRKHSANRFLALLWYTNFGESCNINRLDCPLR
jgi:hypothetical protein